MTQPTWLSVAECISKGFSSARIPVRAACLADCASCHSLTRNVHDEALAHLAQCCGVHVKRLQFGQDACQGSVLGAQGLPLVTS